MRSLRRSPGRSWSALAPLLAALAGCARGPEERRPSVILVSIDTLRADHVGLYGYERDTTPFLDRWSRDALVFERAYTPCAWTLIAHMTMLTGLFPPQHGVTEGEVALANEIPLVAERLQDAGYRTVGLYYPGWIHERHGFGRGFQVFRSHDDAEEAGAHLGEELEELDPERPFFLFLHLFDVHSGPFKHGEHAIYPSPAPFQDFFLPGATERLPRIPEVELWDSEHLLDEPQVEALVALYDGGIRHVDTRLQEWFGELERRGLLENTLVIVTADHGEALMQRGRVSGHGGFWNEGLQVPLLVRHPQGLRAGERVQQIVHLGDIVPTVLETAGLAPDPTLPGRSLLGELPPERVILGSRPPREYVLRWPQKILRSFTGKHFGTDLANDPQELDPQFVSRELFEQWRAEALPSRPFPAPLPIGAMSAEQREHLQALGYAGELDEDEGQPGDEQD